MQPLFFDTETTGNGENDRLCQIAWKTQNETVNELFNPPLPISYEAMSVHHITQKMVDDKPAFKDSETWKKAKEMFESTDYIPVAHNVQFDLAMLEKEGITPPHSICTLKVARALDIDGKLPMYKLQYLRYALDLNVEGMAHDALGDVLVLEKLFERLLAKLTEQKGSKEEALKEMIAISSRPSFIQTFGFGKHTGKKVRDVDPGYLEWLLVQKETNNPEDVDWIYTLKTVLGKT